ncbi:MAG: F0F1 ATP synthase subunit A, partial [Alphaproteobacteria bacterium]
MASPLQQFEIKTIASAHVGGVNVSFTNSSLFMLIAITAITAFLVIGVRKRAMVPGRMQSLAELFYEFIAGLVRDNVGHAGRAYFPFIFTLFMFILFCNTIGLIPYTFTVTSHIIVTFALAFIVFIGVTIIGIAKHGMKWFSYFFPPGAPLYMAPLLVPIEVLSYLARPVTLSLRLFANMMAGHTMLKVFAGFVIALGLFGVAPLVILIALYMLELIVAVL